MADEEEKQNDYTIPFRRFLGLSGIVGNPMTADGLREPTSTEEMAAVYQHQVRVQPGITRDGTGNPTLAVELHRFERAPTDKPLFAPGLDPVFLLYAEQGKVETRNRGLVQYISPEGPALWPDRYTLEPTLGLAHIESAETAKRRLKYLAQKRDDKPAMIYLEWGMIKRAVEDGEGRLFKASRAGRFGAYFYQRRTAEDGRHELWVGRLPREGRNQEPDGKGMLEIDPNRNGVVVCLTADFLEQLLLVVGDCIVPEIELMYRQFYVENK